MALPFVPRRAAASLWLALLAVVLCGALARLHVTKHEQQMVRSKDLGTYAVRADGAARHWFFCEAASVALFFLFFFSVWSFGAWYCLSSVPSLPRLTNPSCCPRCLLLQVTGGTTNCTKCDRHCIPEGWQSNRKDDNGLGPCTTSSLMPHCHDFCDRCEAGGLDDNYHPDICRPMQLNLPTR